MRRGLSGPSMIFTRFDSGDRRHQLYAPPGYLSLEQ